MKIIIAGYGFVGRAVDAALSPLHETVIVDPAHNTNRIGSHNDADGIVVCVGTPATKDGYCDISDVINVIDQVPIHIPILIKSTILPDLLTKIEKKYPDHSICYSPEFLRERTAINDFLSQQYMVIGGEDPEYFWQDLFKECLKKCKLFFNCTMQEASIAKYATNSFLAVKVSFFNQLLDLCINSKVDFDAVRQIVASDPRIGPSHTLVPGPDGYFGFGGRCLPKDASAFSQYADNVSSPVELVEMAIKYNNKVRKGS